MSVNVRCSKGRSRHAMIDMSAYRQGPPATSMIVSVATDWGSRDSVIERMNAAFSGPTAP